MERLNIMLENYPNRVTSWDDYPDGQIHIELEQGYEWSDSKSGSLRMFYSIEEVLSSLYLVRVVMNERVQDCV